MPKPETPDDDPLAGVEPERAARIHRALRRGEALTDPDDAALAVAAADRLQAMWRENRWWRLVDWLLLALAVAAPLLSLHSWKAALVLFAISLPGLLIRFVLLPHVLRRSAEAARRNRALLEAFGSEGEEALRRAGIGERRSA